MVSRYFFFFIIGRIYISTVFCFFFFFQGVHLRVIFKMHNLDYCNNDNIITTKLIKYMKFIGTCHVQAR